MKRSEKKLWMLVSMLLYLSHLHQNEQVKFLFYAGMVRNYRIDLNTLFNRMINKQEEQQQINRRVSDLADFARRFN